MFAPPTSPPAALPPPAPWSRAAYTSRRARPSTRAQRTARPPAHSRGNPDSARNRSRLSPTRPKMLPGRTILRRERKSDCAESGGLPDQGTIPSANTHLQRQSPAEAGLCRDQEVESPVSAPKARLPMTHLCHLSSRRRRALARGTRVFVLRKGRGLWAFRSRAGSICRLARQSAPGQPRVSLTGSSGYSRRDMRGPGSQALRHS